MENKERILLGLTMLAALLFGFLHPLWPDSPVSLKRLHIFLFNLCSGGALILYFVEKSKDVSLKVKLYFLISVLYAFFAAAGWYIATLVISIPLLAVVESVRIKRFSLFPLDFFSRKTTVSDKFQHSAILCLSLGILIAGLVILNNEYLGYVSFEKLSLDVFFLGYSFPISLITMSIMFHFLKDTPGRTAAIIMEASFWLINLGVITFFVFIIFEMLILEILASSVLFVTVIVIFFMFLINAPKVQQKTFLISGMSFLLFTALTGVLYVLKYFFPELDGYAELMLVGHATISLYGWNLSGLLIIIRWRDFPIRLNSALSIFLHWVIVFVLAPLGKFYHYFAFAAVPAYMALLGIVFLSRGNKADRR
jgi:hypothetical protein